MGIAAFIASALMPKRPVVLATTYGDSDYVPLTYGDIWGKKLDRILREREIDAAVREGLKDVPLWLWEDFVDRRYMDNPFQYRIRMAWRRAHPSAA